MIAVDTNVIVRLLTADDRAQTRKAVRLMSENTVRLPKTVLLESEWVLRRAYGLTPSVIGEAFKKLLGLANVSVEDEETVALALRAFGEGMDLADALHVASSRGAEAFVTFDRKLARTARKVRGLPGVHAP